MAHPTTTVMTATTTTTKNIDLSISWSPTYFQLPIWLNRSFILVLVPPPPPFHITSPCSLNVFEVQIMWWRNWRGSLWLLSESFGLEGGLLSSHFEYLYTPSDVLEAATSSTIFFHIMTLWLVLSVIFASNFTSYIPHS